ncbi:MAG: phage scaffolding protein [Lachnospiraceae bacterium]|jgi:hypothetical protein|nr:phage scaffolding protein [Lachnospiraceae bacterium]
MLQELLKKLGYTEEDITKIAKGLSDEKIFLTKEENIEERYAKMKASKEEAEGKLKTAEETSTKIQAEYENYKKGSITQAEYDAKVKEIQDDADKKVKNNEFMTKLEIKLMSKEIGSKDTKDVKANLDLTKISIDGENFLGLDEQVKLIKEKKPYLFNETTEIIKGQDDPNKNKVDPNTPDFSKMSYDELAKYVEENPDAEI